MLETVVEKKIPPPLPPKTRRSYLKTDGDGSSSGSSDGGATILSNGHVVKIRIDPTNGDGGERDGDPPRREHAVGRRSSTVKINITCVDPCAFRRCCDKDRDDHDDENDDEDDRRSLSGHRSPLDSGTGSDLETGSRRDESDDGTCSSCDSLTSSGAADAETTAVPAVVRASPATAVVDDGPSTVSATIVDELPKRSPAPPPVVRVQQRCYGDTADAAVDRVIDMDNTDQYYSFHMNENVFVEPTDARDAAARASGDGDDTFAGCKTAAVSDTIRSAKGTIRGVKNRVRAGIATFLQPKINKVGERERVAIFVGHETPGGTGGDWHLPSYGNCYAVRRIGRMYV